jgi:hypothetical protein
MTTLVGSQLNFYKFVPTHHYVLYIAYILTLLRQLKIYKQLPVGDKVHVEVQIQ